MHTSLNCQHHSHPSLHLLIIPCNQAQGCWDQYVYAHNQDLCESWKFLSSVSELLIAYIKILINKSLKQMLSCANGVGLQAWRGVFGLVPVTGKTEPAARKTDCLRPATGGLIHPSCTYFFIFDIDGLLFCSTGEGNRGRPTVLFVYVLSS